MQHKQDGCKVEQQKTIAELTKELEILNRLTEAKKKEIREAYKKLKIKL